MILLPPTTYLRLLRCPTIDQCDLSSVRLVQSAAGATTKPIIQAIYDKFPNAVLNYGWGQSESGAGSSLKITRAMLEADSPLLESVGRPMKHVEMKVVDEDGNEVLRGWYMRHENRQPCVINDWLKPDDVDHIVLHDSMADWNMPRRIIPTKITPPHRIEVIE